MPMLGKKRSMNDAPWPQDWMAGVLISCHLQEITEDIRILNFLPYLNTYLIRCSSIGGKTWRKKEVSLSMLWKTSELCQRRTATQSGPKERVKLAWNHIRLWGKKRACAMHEMLIR